MKRVIEESKSKFTKKLIVKSMGLALVSMALSAQANEVKELSTTHVKEEKKAGYKVEKASSPKYTGSLLDTPKTINIITSEVLNDQGVTSLNDALRNVTGVSTFGAGEGGGGNITTNDKITIRGFNANGNIYIDGIRDIAGYSRDMFNIEQLEVTKGANSSVSGKGSSGGTINLVTKRALQDDFVTSNISYDQAERLRFTADANQQFSDSVSARINALYTKGGDPLDNDVEDYKTLAIAPSMKFVVGEKTNIVADFLYMKQDNNPMLGLPWINANAATQLGLPEGPIDTSSWGNYYGVADRDFEKVEVAMGTLLIEHQVSDNLMLRSQTRVARNEKKSTVSRPILKNDRDPETREYTYYNEIDIHSRTQNIDQENSLFVTQFDAVTQLDTAGINHDLVLGAEYYIEEVTKQKLIDNRVFTNPYVSLTNPNPNLPYTGSVDIDGKPAKTKGKGWAIYALDTLTITENWLLTLGARFEDYQATGSTYFRRDPILYENIKVDGTFVSWNSSIAYKPNVNSTYYIGVANSQDPTGGELAFSGRSEEQLKQYNALDPQEATSYDLGAKWDLLDQSLQISAALFLTRKTVIDRDDNRTPFLSGEQEAKGLELTVTGKLSDNLNILAGYTHQKTEVTQDLSIETQGNGLTAAPENSANVWVTYDMDKLTLGAGGQYSSGDIYWRRNTEYFDSGSLTLFNAMASYTFSDNLLLQFNVDNIADKEYIIDFSAKGHFRPGPGRNMKLSLRYQF
ncbi:TonB-dependent siderophore receptor [Shewanella sp. D64]|uniref:TonB-dependent receptor n=1 Tax=unclassified Shewanella TaxID=196818 RepID=UPI0022BA418C|nr:MULTISPECIES: TonB-dependent siderophore receptor [unclassified Shewanella]MEC4727656.1 TonB-dependent siderophore receptor [Shewanella sp. D64]MEC4739771.1 TonB-dependent siderophore receptor [Shewanella sp. E94]WBJ94055.1 TonB-dependent siderophore receptor [Shewanella sp. MTB7]